MDEYAISTDGMITRLIALIRFCINAGQSDAHPAAKPGNSESQTLKKHIGINTGKEPVDFLTILPE